MAVRLDHTIVPAHDKHIAAGFLAEVLGLPEPKAVGHFLAVSTGNGVTLDFDDHDELVPGHYAFMVDDDEFDEILGRVLERGIRHWQDPAHRHEGVRDHRGRGFYFEDPSGHNMEVLTPPPEEAASTSSA